MLIEFRVENHRSLRDEQVLTMEAARVGDATDPRPRQLAGYSEKLLPVAALYGANASGKSNVLAALAFMCDAVLLSQAIWAPDAGVPREAFAWGPKRTEPSLFEAVFLIDGIRYQYGFVADDRSFLEEWLYVWPKGKKRTWFERDETAFKFGGDLRGKNKLIQELTRPNSLFLSASAQNMHPMLTSVFSWFRAIQRINLFRDRHSRAISFPPSPSAMRLITDQTPERKGRPPSGDDLYKRFSKLLLPFLKNADLGIVDLKMNRVESKESPTDPALTVLVKHRSEFDESWLPLQQESEGTLSLLVIALPMVVAIQEGWILLVDELEDSLHPSLARQIVRQFNDPVTNPRNAQLIFTTHDTNLLGTTIGDPSLRRDQIWLTEKNPDGATELYPLTDYIPRKAENLERGYLQGRYGAVPFLGRFSVAGE